MVILCYVRARKQETHGRIRYYKVCAMVQAVGRRPVAAEARVRLQSRPCEICGEQSGNGMFIFLRLLQSFPIDITPPVIHTHLTFRSYQKDKRARSRNPPKSNALSEMGDHSTEKHCHVFKSIRFMKRD